MPGPAGYANYEITLAVAALNPLAAVPKAPQR